MIVQHPAISAAIARGRADAREIVTHGERYTEQRRLVAWAALVGQCPHPQARRQCVNMGAPAPQPGWNRLATVIEGGSNATV